MATPSMRPANYVVSNADTSIDGSSVLYFDLADVADDSATYQDSASYSGTPGSTNQAPTVSGSNADYNSTSDSSMESIHGSFTNDNGTVTAVGLTSTTASSSASYSSGGSDGSKQGQTSSSGDVSTDNGSLSASFNSSGSYSLVPALASSACA